MREMKFTLFTLVFVLAACSSAVTPAESPIVQEPEPTIETPSEPTVETAAEPVTLRLAVSLTPQELETFQPALTAVDEAHPEFDINLEVIPQQSVVEKINTQLAAGDMPDVFRAQGLQVQQWIRQDAFLDLTALINENNLNTAEFYPGPLEQFVWQDKLYGIPDTAAPEIAFYNKAMFDAAGLDYPTDDWSLEDMRTAAVLLTLDEEGRNPTDPDFDPEAIVQWGWNGSLTYFWQRHLVQPFGGEFCANVDCTLMTFTSPETIEAVQWWADFTHLDHATLYDPFGGSQTGVPGDPFMAKKAAMGYNGFFFVGQLNSSSDIEYDIVQPFADENGNRYTTLSTNGYVISADTEHPEAAWMLVEALTEADFLASTWGEPAHAVPARRTAAESVINLDHAPANQQAIVAAMEYGEVFKPYTSSAFAVYGQTAELFQGMMKGEASVPETLAEIEQIANETLALDRGE